MAGYDDTREKILETLLQRPVGTEIQPENHQDFALSLLDYIRSVELISGSTLIGIANQDTVPVQSNVSNEAYIAGVAQEHTVVFKNFRDENGEPLTVTTGEMEAKLVILIWNKQHWSKQEISANIISQSENANFYYRYNIRKTYASYTEMEADNTNPIGIDGKYIKQGEIVSVVNNSDTSKNGFYSYTNTGWKFQTSFSFQIANEFGEDVNKSISQKFFTEQVQDRTIASIDISELDSLGIQEDFSNYGIYKVIAKDEVNGTTSAHGLLKVIAESTNEVRTQRYYTHDLLDESGNNFSGTDVNTAHVYERSYFKDTKKWSTWQNIISNDFGSSTTKPISQKFFTEQVQGTTIQVVTVEDESEIDKLIEQGVYKIGVVSYGAVRNSYLLFVSHNSSSDGIISSEQVKIDNGNVSMRTCTVKKDKTVSWKSWNNITFKNAILSKDEYDNLTYKDDDVFYLTYENE